MLLYSCITPSKLAKKHIGSVKLGLGIDFALSRIHVSGFIQLKWKPVLLSSFWPTAGHPGLYFPNFGHSNSNCGRLHMLAHDCSATLQFMFATVIQWLH